MRTIYLTHLQYLLRSITLLRASKAMKSKAIDKENMFREHCSDPECQLSLGHCYIICHLQFPLCDFPMSSSFLLNCPPRLPCSCPPLLSAQFYRFPFLLKWYCLLPILVLIGSAPTCVLWVCIYVLFHVSHLLLCMYTGCSMSV